MPAIPAGQPLPQPAARLRARLAELREHTADRAGEVKRVCNRLGVAAPCGSLSPGAGGGESAATD